MNGPGDVTDLRDVTVRLFAAAKDRAESDTVTVRLPVVAVIGDVRAALCETVPALRPLAKHLLFAVGTDYAADAAAVPDGAEIAAFPPVSGG